MLYGDEVIVYRDSIEVAEKSMEAIRVEHGSCCWGVWLPDSRLDPQTQNSAPSDLFLSPVPTESWPCAIRVQVALSEMPGSLAKACDALAANNWNILFSRSVATGYYHATWNVVLEPTDKDRDDWFRRNTQLQGLRQKLPQGGRKGPTRKQLAQIARIDREIRQLTNDLQRYVFLFITKVRKALLEANDKSDVPFLHKKLMPPRSKLFWKVSPAKLDLRGFYTNPAIIGDPMPFMMWAWLYGENPLRPLQFKYDSKLSRLLLDVSQQAMFAKRTGVAARAASAKTIATINAEEPFLRILFRQAKLDHARVRFDVPYETSTKNVSRTFFTSRGTLSRITGALSKEGVNIVRSSNRLIYRGSDRESGIIRITANVPGMPAEGRTESDLTKQENRLKKLRSVIEVEGSGQRNNTDTTIRSQSISAKLDSIDLLFVSVRYEIFKTHNDLEKRIEEVASEMAFLATTVKAEETIRGAVDQRLRNAVAFLQIIPSPITDQSPNATINDCNLDWLMFESGFASACNIPIEVCVDTKGGVNHTKWAGRLTQYAGKVFWEFSSSNNTDQIVAEIRKAIAQLRRRVTSQ